MSVAREEKEGLNGSLEKPTVYGWEVLHLYLDIPKTEHLKIIERRTDKMIEMGLIDETRSLLQRGFSGLEKPLQSIGYKESLDYLKGNFESLNECRDRIIISTRQLAKSQRTWFNRDPFKEQYNPLEQRNEIFVRVEKFLQS